LCQRVPVAPRLPAAQKVGRDQRIVGDRARGLAWATIAERHGLSERQCQNIIAEHLAAQRHVTNDDVARYVDELLLQLDRAVEEFALLAERTGNDPVRLGALKAKAGLLVQRLAILRLCGRIPADPYQLQWAVDAQRVRDVLLSVFGRYEVPDAALHEVRAAFTVRADAA
jgi:hypothetical protein